MAMPVEVAVDPFMSAPQQRAPNAPPADDTAFDDHLSAHITEQQTEPLDPPASKSEQHGDAPAAGETTKQHPHNTRHDHQQQQQSSPADIKAPVSAAIAVQVIASEAQQLTAAANDAQTADNAPAAENPPVPALVANMIFNAPRVQAPPPQTATSQSVAAAQLSASAASAEQAVAPQSQQHAGAQTAQTSLPATGSETPPPIPAQIAQQPAAKAAKPTTETNPTFAGAACDAPAGPQPANTHDTQTTSAQPHAAPAQPITTPPSTDIAAALAANPLTAAPAMAANTGELSALAAQTAPGDAAKAGAKPAPQHATAAPAESAKPQAAATDTPKMDAAAAAPPVNPLVAAARSTTKTSSASEPAPKVAASVDASAPAADAAPQLEASRDAQTLTDTQATDAAPRAPHAAQQVSREIVRRFNGGGAQFDIRLDPPELGRVDVKLEVSRDNKVTATITADSPQALTDLARAARDIQQSLQSAGLDLAENGLSFDLSQRQTQENFAGASEAGHRRGSAFASENEAPAPTQTARPFGLERWRGVRVDLVA